MWNNSIHYHRVILDAVPAGCERALDVGCGEGVLARQLREVVSDVTAIDVDTPSIEAARRHGADVEYVVGDVLTFPFEAASFDLVAAVAALHHMDTEAGLLRMKELVRPGGVVAVIGLARSRSPLDFARDAVGAVATRLHRVTKTYTEQTAPTVWPPRDTYGEVRRIAARVLPGSQFRRRLLFRYTLVWTKPAV